MTADTWTPADPVTCPAHPGAGCWLSCMDYRRAYEARCADLGLHSRRLPWWRRALRATTRPHGGRR